MNAETDGALLPCPFCGGMDIKPYIIKDGDERVHYAQCADCTACGPDHQNWRHWNARAPSAPPMNADTERGDGRAAFTEYFVKNYPGPKTIISNPYWHAPKIFRAAQYAIDAARAPSAPGPEVAPVAWQYTLDGKPAHKLFAAERWPDIADLGNVWHESPLYAAPVAPEQQQQTVVDAGSASAVEAARFDAPETWPECQEFYNLMQIYRHTLISDPVGTVNAYKAVKAFIRAGFTLTDEGWEPCAVASLAAATEAAGQSKPTAVDVEVAAAIERVRAFADFSEGERIATDIRLVCAAASRAVGPPREPTE